MLLPAPHIEFMLHFCLSIFEIEGPQNKNNVEEGLHKDHHD